MLIEDIKNKAGSQHIANPYTHMSYSQFGEDIVLWSILKTRGRLDNGFYVDVGAFHPFKHSNTALLHLFRGWHGVNIDANSEAIDLFNEHRPTDTNIVAAVSDEVSEVEYLRFHRAAVNTLDPAMQMKQTQAGKPFKVKDRQIVQTKRLRDILGGLADPPKKIDLMSVDCEGLDYRVLVSNDWDRFRPFIIAVEAHGMNLQALSNNPTNSLLLEQGYRLVSHVFVTSIYVKVDSRGS